MHQRVSVVLAVVLALYALRGEARAQDEGICTIANTCSEAFFQCVAVNCPATFDPRCSGLCRARFDGCMRTGGFGGRDCRHKMLLRK